MDKRTSSQNEVKSEFDFLKTLFFLGVGVAARIARKPQMAAITRTLMRLFGTATLVVYRGKPKFTVAEVASEWRRMFAPTMRKDIPIIRQDERTVVHELRVDCPLRGTGDVTACHRMMEYDRKMLEKIGGEFVVLHSQAEPGRTTCEVAIRRKGESMADLKPIHLHFPKKAAPVSTDSNI